MFEVKSPLTYYPMTVGDYTLSHTENKSSFTLAEKQSGWMGYNYDNHWQAREFYFELQLAKGVCITTGLGLGILQTNLCLNDNVSKVIVYEKSNDVVDIFYKTIEKNNFDISKIEIRIGDADLLANEKCDCLFPDHFDSEPEEHIVRVVKELSENNQADVVWYWPAGVHLLKFLISKELEINNDSYEKWKKYTGITNLPCITDDSVFAYFKELKNMYQNEADVIGFKVEITSVEKTVEHRNKLLALYKK
jgi:hypothetical protein